MVGTRSAAACALLFLMVACVIFAVPAHAQDCAPGSFSADGQEPCSACDPGSFTAASASTTCALCDLGSFAAVAGSTECTDCPAGTFADATGSAVCGTCAPGTAQPDEGATQCLECDAGSPGDGATECRSCAQPVSAGASPLASDALFILRTAVGSEECDGCVCDVDASGHIVSSDSLITLRAAVGQAVETRCPSCPVTAIADGETFLVLTSADGLLVVDVPPAAVPIGTIITLGGVASSDLPEELAAASGAYAYRLGPEAVDFAVAGTGYYLVDSEIIEDDDSFASGAALLFGSLAGEPAALPQPEVYLDVDSDESYSTASIERTGLIIAATISGLNVRVDGVPGTSAVGVPVDVTTSVTHVDADVEYSDTEFGGFAPEGGVIEAVLPATGEGQSGATYAYACTSAGEASFEVNVDVVYDAAALVDGVFGAGSSTSGESLPVVFHPSKTLVCE